MPRQARLDSPGTLHHIMIRGIEGCDIFKDNDDRKEFITRIEKIILKTGDRIVAWALMKNHVHLLIFSGIHGISKFMRCLLTGYALWYNRKYKRKGHLFQNRYKSIICEEETYLLELIRYIHLNPLRASVVKNIDELDRYPWTGHSVLIEKNKKVFQEKEYVLKQFGSNGKTSISMYKKFIKEGVNQGKRPELVGGGLIRSMGGWSKVKSLKNESKMEYDSRILGSGNFVSDIIKEADSIMKRQLNLNERKKIINQTIKKMCTEEKIKEQEIRNGGRNRKVSLLRSKISQLLYHEYGISAAELARNLGVCTSAIAKAILAIDNKC